MPGPERSISRLARLLLDRGPAGVALLEGPELVYTYVNEAYQALAPRKPMVGRSFAQVWPEAAALVLPVLQRIRASGREEAFADQRVDVRRSDDGPVEEAYWSVTFQPLAGTGDPPAIAIHVVDRTQAVVDRRRAEALQVEQERLLDEQRALRGAEQLAEAIPQIVWTAGPSGAAEWFNRRWYEYTGLTPAQSMGDGWRAVIHEYDAPRTVNRFLTSLRAGGAVDVEARLRAAGGGWRWHLLRAVPLRNEGGRILKWFGTATDVEAQRRTRDQAETARRREAEARVAAEETSVDAHRRAAQLDAVFDSVADGLVVTTLEGELERANETAGRLLGGPARGADWLAGFAALDEEGREVPAEALAPSRALRGEVVRGQELRLDRRDGTGPAWLSVSAAPVRSEAGAILGVVTTFTDLSRVRELQERQKDLLRVVSHDLRTPLTVIMTHAQLLERKVDDAATVRRRAQTLRTSAQRMASMIDDLVDLVRLEAGLVRLAPVPVRLAPFAAELRERLGGAVAVDRLRLEVPEALPPVRADPARLERILVNLVSNALKYSPPEREAVLRAAPHGGGLRLTVEDRGPGIPPEERPHLFDRFYRSPSQARTEGLGLGLYITRLLVEAHGGRITVESEVGRGSAFHVDLPAEG